MRVISIISGKGGVGKTTTAANLGVALASEFKKEVVLIDGNITTPNLVLHLGIYSFSTSLEDILDGRVSISRAMQRHKSGVKLLPAPMALSRTYPDLRKLKDLLNELRYYEFILIDSCPGLGGEIIPALEMCDEVLIVTNPELPAVTEALRAIEVAKRNNVPVGGVILNRVMNERHELSVSEIELFLGAKVIAVVPEDSMVREGIASGNPVVLSSPNSPAAIEFKKLAARLAGREYKIGFFAKLRNFFRLRRKPEPLVAGEERMIKEAVIKVEEILKKEGEVEKKPIIPAPPPVEKMEEAPKIAVEVKIGEMLERMRSLNNLKLKKGMAESILKELNIKYGKGLVEKAIYEKLKGMYERELSERSKEIEKLEAEMEKQKTEL